MSNSPTPSQSEGPRDLDSEARAILAGYHLAYEPDYDGQKYSLAEAGRAIVALILSREQEANNETVRVRAELALCLGKLRALGSPDETLERELGLTTNTSEEKAS